MLAHEGQAEFDTREFEACGVVLATIDTDKGVQVFGTDSENLGLYGAGIRQGEGLGCTGFLDGKFSIDLHKAKDVQVQAAHSLGVNTPATVQAQSLFTGRAGEDGQIGLAVTVVDHGAITGCAVDVELERTDLGTETFYAHKGCRAHFGLQTGPALGYRIGGDLRWCERLCEEGQTQVDIRQAQTHVARAHKGVGPVGANEQHVDIGGCGRFVHRGGGCVVSQGHLPGLFLNGKATTDLHKAKDVDVQVAHGTGEVSFAGVQGQGAAGGLGRGAGVDLQVLRFVVHQRAVCRSTVDLYCEGVGTQGQAVNADHACAGGTG